jgi:hypothetical protein
MLLLVFGAIAVLLGLWVLNVISRVDPAVGARILKTSGGLIALGLAVFLGLRGELGIAMLLGATGLGLLGWTRLGLLDLTNFYRRDAGGREDAQGDAAAGRPASSSGKMSEQEAYEILGLQPGASVDDIGHAHRTLMKKFHPDQGGSTYLAARINEAKEVLVRRHR